MKHGGGRYAGRSDHAQTTISRPSAAARRLQNRDGCDCRLENGGRDHEGSRPPRPDRYNRTKPRPPHVSGHAGKETGETMRDHVLRGVALLHLRICQCRFPIQEDLTVPGGHRFCAEATSPHRVYCARHHRIAITSPKSQTGRVSFSSHKRRRATRSGPAGCDTPTGYVICSAGRATFRSSRIVLKEF